LTNNRIFADMSSNLVGVPDGMKVDMDGRVWCTGNGGTQIYDKDGVHVGDLRTDEVPANCAWGGSDNRTLFLTARTSVYTVRVKTPGTPIPLDA
jgi:gluconolactonase